MRNTFITNHLSLTILFLCLLSCSGGAQQKRANAADSADKQLHLTLPESNSQIHNNDSVTIKYVKPNFSCDSVVAFLDGKRLARLNDTLVRVKVSIQIYGRKSLLVKLFSKIDGVMTASVGITVLPAHPPKMYGYRLVSSYPHDRQAYTQGLQIQDGILYEGVGQYGQSAVRRVDLKSGKVLQSKELSRKYFGEGICVLNGLLYQLTWREQTCFVYDSKTLELQATIPYSGEGWGLTTDGNSLIMSNGTNVITFRSPNDFSVRKRLEVYTDKEYMAYLNELELINGELWANVYGADYIVRIDTASGAVTSIVNFAGLLPENLKDRNTDVFNGIAYNSKTKQIFVTGKNWKRLFEVKVE